MKKKLLFVGIIMNSGGTEKSFLSLAEAIDYTKYDVDLLLAKKEGAFMDLIPKEVNVIEMEKYGEHFLQSGKNAVQNLWSTFVKDNPFALFEILPYFLKIIFNRKKKTKYVIELWIKMARKFAPIETKYDAAISFWGDRAMFYMVDKVRNAKKKITWMHFDYDTPPRDDEIYLKYFKECDKIVNVSAVVDDKLKERLPGIKDKCVIIENIQNAEVIKRLSLEPDSFPDVQYKGRRILTIGRFSYQKGFDMIPPVLSRLRENGYEVRWYVIGDGKSEEKEPIISLALQYNVADSFLFLGEKINPYPFLKDCDLYCQPSRFEGKPISVEEAKIMACPIVAANYLSASEQLNGGRYGLICDISEDSLYNAVKTMLDSPDMCEKFSITLHNEVKGNLEEVEKFYAILNL